MPSKESGHNPRIVPHKRRRIGELLVTEGIVDREHVEQALSVQKEKGGKIVEILIEEGHMDVQSFARFLSNQRGIPSIQLSNFQVLPELCDLIPRDFAIQHEVFPVDKLGRLLTVGMTCPLDSETLAELEELTNLRVKAFLCSADDVRNAIARYYPREGAKPAADAKEAEHIESSVKLGSIARLIRQIDALPTLPQTVRKVEQATEDPDVSLQDVAAIVSGDPPIAARLLKLANSAIYGFPHKINTVEMATTLLGLKETYMVVLSSAVIDLLEKSNRFDYERFWEDSMYCAKAARTLAADCKEDELSGVFTAGLLHDIGRFALAETAPGPYGRVDAALVGDDLVREEEKVLGIAHPEAGYLLAEHWNLPDEISEAIRFHHAPENANGHKEFVSIIAVAAALTEARWDPPSNADELFNLNAALFTEMGLDADDVYKLFTETEETVGKEAG